MSDQPPQNLAAVKMIRHAEERILRALDSLEADGAPDINWLIIGRTHIELGFMAVIRSILQPERMDIKE